MARPLYDRTGHRSLCGTLSWRPPDSPLDGRIWRGCPLPFWSNWSNLWNSFSRISMRHVPSIAHAMASAKKHLWNTHTNTNAHKFNFFYFVFGFEWWKYWCWTERNEPLARKLAESEISEPESSLFGLSFHSKSLNFDGNGFPVKLLLLRFKRKSPTCLSCSASDVFAMPVYDIFFSFAFAAKKIKISGMPTESLFSRRPKTHKSNDFRRWTWLL